MKRLILTIAIVITVLAVGMRAQAVPPNPVASLYTYQGAIFVEDESFDGTGLFKMAIVNQDGQTVWSNDGTSVDGGEPAGDIAVAVDKGVFFILLGDNNTPGMAEIDPSIFATDDTLFLKTWFDDGSSGFAEMVPAIELTASAFAINSQFLRGYGPDDFFLNSSQITSSQIAAGAIGATQIAANSVTGDKITAFSNNNTDFTVGRGVDENVQIIASTGVVNEPGLRYDSTTDAWQFSNDGTTWNDIGSGAGSGTVNAGAINELAYYAAAGTAVSGLTTANNGVLVTSGGGVPSISSTLPAGVQGNITSVGTIGSGTWQGNAVANGFVADDLTISGGTVNNSVIGGTAPLAGTFRGLIDELDTVIQGGDLTIGLGTTAYSGRIVLHDADAADSFTTTIQSNANVPASFSLILPVDDGNASEVLTTDGSGNLSWSAVAGGDVTGPAASTDNAVTRFDGAGGKTLQNSGVIVDDSNNVSGIAALSISSMGANWTNVGRTVADLGSVTTVDINGGTIDAVSIGQGTAGLGTFTDLVASTLLVGTVNQGDILYDNGTTFVRLAPGTSGQVLQTQGAAANPQWATPGSSAPTDATYITQTSDATLTNEQALSSLSTGVMQVTAGTGVVSSVTTSAGLAALISNETGSGALVFGVSPNLATPSIAGSTITGDNDAGGAASFEIPNSAAPTVDAAGEIAVDTVVPDYTGMVKYHDGSEELTVLAVPTANLSTTGGQVVAYNDANDELEFVSPGSGRVIPFITTTATQLVEPSATKTITLNGTNFVPTSVVSIPGFDGTINSTGILSPVKFEINLTAGTTETFYDIVVSNNGVLNTEWSGNGQNLLEVRTSTWIDLRSGGDVFTDGNAAGNDVRYRVGMSMNRDANGISFSGSSPWSSWVKFEFLGWTRGANQTVQWVLTRPTTAMMIGIGSDATNEGNTAQYSQAEVEAYFSSSNNLWGLYGNNGTVGTAGSQSGGAILTCASDTFKVKFEDDGDAGDQFTLYCLPSTAQGDWDDEANVLTTYSIGGTLNPNEPNIMPFIIPQNGGAQRFVAVKVE